MRAILWKLHQYVGIVASIGMVLWGLSGVLHPIMARLQAAPATRMPPAQSVDLQQALPLGSILQQNSVTEVAHIALAQITPSTADSTSTAATTTKQSAWRVAAPETTHQAPRYFDVYTGEELHGFGKTYAQQLARHYTGLTAEASTISDSKLLHHFNRQYSPFNRLLPVWQVQFDKDSDHLRAYVDTSRGGLATLANPTRDTLSAAFQWMHSWRFLSGVPWLQTTIMVVLLIALGFSALTGIYFYIVLWGSASKRLRGKPLRRSHRVLGATVSVFALMAFFSGGYHHLHKIIAGGSHHQIEKTATYTTADIAASNWQAIQSAGAIRNIYLATHQGALVWMLEPASNTGHAAQVANLKQEHDHRHKHQHDHNGKKHTAATPQTKLIDQQGNTLDATTTLPAMAVELATHFSQQPAVAATDVQRITRFGGEYGFFNKHLPVYKVQWAQKENTRYYVDLTAGKLASTVNDWDALEGKSFAYLHKWRFLDVDKSVRDFLLGAFALALAVVGTLGLLLFCRQPKQIAH